jgi:large conductance mechanosensitive channel
MLKEFKEFALKGNMLDMAIGIIIGAAFGSIVTSLVNDVFNPIFGVLTGGQDFSNKFFILKDAVDGAVYPTLAAAKAAGAVTINYGLFINAAINFTIVAFVLFMIVKMANKLKKAEAAAPTVAPPAQEVLLAEIRDLLKK